MSSNISGFRPRPPPPPPELVVEAPVLVAPAPVELLSSEELVEYFVEELDDEPVSISVPKSVHSSQTFNFAPSILTRFGDDVSVPHISHWTISSLGHPSA
jgi:hypothetical protein